MLSCTSFLPEINKAQEPEIISMSFQMQGKASSNKLNYTCWN